MIWAPKKGLENGVRLLGPELIKHISNISLDPRKYVQQLNACVSCRYDKIDVNEDWLNLLLKLHP